MVAETTVMERVTDWPEALAQDAITTLVISDSTLMRAGIKALLSTPRFILQGEAGTIADALDGRDGAPVPDLVAIGTTKKVPAAEPVKALRTAFPNARIVFFVEPNDLSAPDLIAAFDAGVDGCLTANMSLPILCRSLDLILLGERIFPFALLKGAMPRESDAPDAGATPSGLSLSEREKQVLRLMRDGYSNKLIARDLHITEATVKVHVKMLLKKTGAANRTQAAIWAVNNLPPEEPPA